MKNKKKIKANIMLLLTAMIWGLAFVAQKDASGYIGSFTFNGIRFMLGSLSLIPVILVFEKSDLKDKKKMKNTLKYGIVTGVFLFIASDLQQLGIQFDTQASKAGFITGIYTVLVPVFGIFLGKKVRANVWLGAVFSVVGLYLISVVGTPVMEFGDLLLLLGAIFWAFHVLAIDCFIDKVSPIKYSCVQFFTCASLNLMLVPFFESQSFSAQNLSSALSSILYAGIMSSGIAYTLQVLGQRDSEPTEAAIIFSLESVFGAIGCVFVLHESISLAACVGCLLIFAGIILSQIKFKSKI